MQESKAVNTQMKNFTLVEMLVVVAVITILAGFILPALNKSQKVGQKTDCTSNLRQIGKKKSFLLFYISPYIIIEVILMMIQESSRIATWDPYFCKGMGSETCRVLRLQRCLSRSLISRPDAKTMELFLRVRRV